jgi:hypothetical protein
MTVASLLIAVTVIVVQLGAKTWNSARVQRLLAKRSEKSRAARLEMLRKRMEGLGDSELISETEDHILYSVFALAMLVVMCMSFALMDEMLMFVAFKNMKVQSAINVSVVMIAVVVAIMFTFATWSLRRLNNYLERVSPSLRNQSEKEIKELTEIAKREEIRKEPFR